MDLDIWIWVEATGSPPLSRSLIQSCLTLKLHDRVKIATVPSGGVDTDASYDRS